MLHHGTTSPVLAHASHTSPHVPLGQSYRRIWAGLKEVRGRKSCSEPFFDLIPRTQERTISAAGKTPVFAKAWPREITPLPMVDAQRLTKELNTVACGMKRDREETGLVVLQSTCELPPPTKDTGRAMYSQSLFCWENDNPNQ